MDNLFVANRQRLTTKLRGGLVVMSAYTSMQRSNDMPALFEQEANFWWLSGIEAPDWWLIIDGMRHKSWLVAPRLRRPGELFDTSLSPEEARTISGVDGVLSPDEGMSMLRDLAKKHSIVHTLGEQPHTEYLDFYLNPAPKRLHDILDRTFNATQDCRKELTQLRAIKQPEEIIRMKKAINLTIEAFDTVKAKLSNLKYEYEVEAEFAYHFRKSGAKGYAFEPVVAAGSNACRFNRGSNDGRLKKRELILINIGAKSRGYAADITRTYTYGEPSKRQRAVHTAVQLAHKQITKLLVPDLIVDQYQKEVDIIMQETLLQLGLIRDDNNKEARLRYFPHAISHGLGVDPHDSLGTLQFFQPGMVLTVEPGVYIPEEGIGVRIADDVLITSSGHTNLSARLSTDL